MKWIRRSSLQFITSLEPKLAQKVTQRKGQRFRQAYRLPPCEGFQGRWKSHQHGPEHGGDAGITTSWVHPCSPGKMSSNFQVFQLYTFKCWTNKSMLPWTSHHAPKSSARATITSFLLIANRTGQCYAHFCMVNLRTLPHLILPSKERTWKGERSWGC